VEYMGYFLLAIVFLLIIVKVFTWPIKLFFKLLANAVLGVILLLVVNFIGGYFNFFIGINWATALIAGCFGVPGVVFLVVFKLFL
jgi:inhibitor of the pro-sigma K processing machinery